MTRRRAANALGGTVLTLVLAAAMGWKGLRHTAPIAVVDDFDGVAVAEGRWRWFGAGGPLVSGGRLILESDPPRSAFLEARFLDPAAARAERVELRAAVRRAGSFLVLLEAWFDKTLLWVQLTGYGIHVTYPGALGDRTGYEVHEPAVTDGGVHLWRLVRDEHTIALEVDGRRVWSAAARGPLTRLRLGDEGSDREHRGTIEVESFRYERRPR